MITVDRLHKVYGAFTAVRALSFRVAAGEVLGLVGPNGAGKTTTLHCLAGIIRPTGGRIEVAGASLLDEPVAAKRALAFVPDEPQLFEYLTVTEHLRFVARLYGVADAPAAAERALGLMRVLDRADAPVRLLSRGLQQRVSIARAMVHGPRVVLLDEPYTGLDAAGAEALTETLTALAAGGAALVLVTHHLDEGLALATQVAVLRAGRLVLHQARAEVAAEGFARAYRDLVAA